MLKPRPLSICLQNQPAMAGKAETLPDISAERRVGTDNVFTRRDPQPRKRKLTAVCSHQTRIGNLDAHLI